MNRSKFLALLTSVAVGASTLAYVATAEDKEAKTEKAETKETAKATSGEDYVVLRYEGGEVKKSDLDRMWNTMFPAADAPSFESFGADVQVEILRNIARERLILDKAYAKNIDKSDEVQNQLEHLKRQLVIQAYFKSILDELVPEAELKKQYDVIVEKYKGKQEVKASHILVESEDKANEIYKKLTDEDADFAELAKAESADTGSGAQGGDLGYFTKERMVPEFAETAFKMSEGEISKPVKTDFGWHIIKVEDKRDMQAPPLEEIREDLQKSLANQAIETYVRNVIDDADVKFYGPEGEELKPAAGE